MTEAEHTRAERAPGADIRTAIVEDRREIREGLSVLINGTPGYACAGSYGSMEEAVEKIGHDLPVVVLCDIGLPGMSGIDGIRLLKERYPSLQLIVLSVYDDDGREVARRDVTLEQNRAASLNFMTPRDLAQGARMQLRAAVTVEQDPSGIIPCIAPTVEVLDPSGAASLLNPGALAGFNRQPDPPMPPDYFEFGFVSAGPGQTLRVNAAYVRGAGALPTDPCRVTISFQDEDGRLVAQTERTLYPGQTVSFDTPGSSRPRLRATVGVAPLTGGVIPCIKPSAEVYDDSTGRTVVLYPGAVIGE